MILILAAMDEELHSIISNNKLINKESILDINLYTIEIANKNVLVAKTGIGKVASSFVLTSILSRYQSIDLVINTGTAGAYDNNLKIYDVVVANKLFFHDVDVTYFGYQYGQMAGCSHYYQSDVGLIESLINTNLPLYYGSILSGDQFIAQKDKMVTIINQYFKDENVLAVDMESAAIGQVCSYFNVKLLVIRVISDELNFNGLKVDFSEIATTCSEIISNLLKKIIKQV